ncbi:MAG: ATP-binding cassette domain-containing protein [Verrucomicrobia bacterium]|nr:ATP-binding cassette domain-containing protein [Verrucomicrobiota bacterium]
MQPPLIRITSLTATRGRQVILREINLEIARGAHVVLCGRSGAGKTTLLRLLAGFEAPAEGRIEIAGRVVTENHRLLVPPEQRGLGMVFQDLGLWPNLTVRGNVYFGLAGKPWGRRERHAAAAAAMSACRLDGLERRRPGQLSSGEQQRTALARAVAGHPEALLLDEPFTALDLILKREMIVLFRTLVADHKLTAITVSHDPFDAGALAADRLIVLEDGRIADSIPTAQLLTLCPQSKLLAEWRKHLLEAGSGPEQASWPPVLR